ncbi:GNAT family N-acetyltransferase [Furfurilactobacillus siliginis]|nr:GNAT family N-acetyltransferase [Furfurilactobacillus siliginis]GEK28002.1 N-acetyltransferase [Furfurilactobacillus siliginis]
MATTIQTKRLTLRTVTEADLAAFTLMANNPQVALPAGFHPVKSAFEADFLMRQMLHQRWLWGIVQTETDLLIGTIGLYGRTGKAGLAVHGERDIGYMLNEDFWGQGYMSEAVQAVLAFGFSKGLRVIHGSYFKDNERSARIFIKNGFQFDHQIMHAQSDFFAPGKTELFYQLTQADFMIATTPID